MNLAHLRSFLAIAELGSFRAAARALSLAQPTISQHLKKLEADLGCGLVKRGRVECALTPSGEVLLGHARSLIAAADRARSAVRGGSLTIGASSNIGIYLLQPHLRGFALGGGGDLRTEIWIGPNPEVARRVSNREIDFALMEWWDGRPGFSGQLWRREPLVVIVSPDHAWATRKRIAAEELRGQPIIGGEAGTGTGRVLREGLGQLADDLTVERQLGSTEAVKSAVKHGLGISLVLAGAVAEEVRHGELATVEIADTRLVKDLYMVCPKELPAAAPARRFADYLERSRLDSSRGTS